MLAEYGYIAILLIVAVLFTLMFPIIPLILTRLGLVPKNSTPEKTSTYECGMETIGNTWVQFNFRYYFFAVLFVALDVLTVFLYPWAVNFTKSGLFGLIAVLVFFVIIMIGYVYAWFKGALQWK